jgi:flagellar biogenesis protein FliO
MELMSQLGAVGVVLALLAGTLWWFRRRGMVSVLPLSRRTPRRLVHLERLPLGPQHALHLVRVGGTDLLVGSSPAGCVLVRSFDGAAGQESEARP